MEQIRGFGIKENVVDLNKLPRWALFYGFIGFMSLGGFMLKGAFADLADNKQLVAKHDLLIPRLISDIQEIKNSSESFRREYREDQKDLDKKLTLLLNKD